MPKGSFHCFFRLFVWEVFIGHFLGWLNKAIPGFGYYCAGFTFSS